MAAHQGASLPKKPLIQTRTWHSICITPKICLQHIDETCRHHPFNSMPQNRKDILCAGEPAYNWTPSKIYRESCSTKGCTACADSQKQDFAYAGLIVMPTFKGY